MEQQSVRLDISYPNVKQGSTAGGPVTWFLAIPHYVVLVILYIGGVCAVIGAWFAILDTGVEVNCRAGDSPQPDDPSLPRRWSTQVRRPRNEVSGL
jgi:hypothetical protein